MDNTAEQFVIGGLLLIGDLSGDQTQKVLSMLKPSSFSDFDLSLAFGAMSSLSDRGLRADPFTVYAEAQKDKRCSPNLEQYLFELAGGVGSSANVVAYAEAVREKAVERYAVQTMNKAMAMITDKTSGDIYQRIGLAESMLSAINDRAMKSGGLTHMSEIGKAWVGQVTDQVERGARGFTLGIDALDRMLYPKRVPAGSLVVVGARPKMGKEQPLDSKILMANGTWKTMGDMAVGDSLASVDGEQSTVTGVFPQGMKDVYAIEFSDGRTVECGLEHLWTVQSSRFSAKEKTMTTAEIARHLTMDRYKNRMCVPGISGDFGQDIELGVDPWLLGVLLGDGGLTNVTPKLTNSESYIIDRVKESLPKGVSLVHKGGIEYSFIGDKWRNNPLADALSNLNLMGCGSPDKHIPDQVFTASKAVRWALLAGLLETDGWVEKAGTLSFCSTSENLADGVAKLVWSLGGVARRRKRTNIKFSYKGEMRDGRDAYCLAIRLPNAREIIKSPRLLANIKEIHKKTATPVILSVRKVREAECQCIMVDHPEHLYATDNYILTHNTAIMGKIISHFALQRKEAVACFSLEMPNIQIYERLIVGESNVNPEIFYRAANDADDWTKVTNAAGAYNQSQLYIDDTPGVRLSHVLREARSLNKKHSIGMVAVDYLTLMEADSAERNDLGYARITKALKNLAKELDCVVLLLTQLNRQLESRPDKRPQPSDSRDTGQIEQDCDLWVGLYREGAYTEHPDDHRTEVIVRLNRHGKTGTVFVEQENGVILETDDQTYRENSHKSNKISY